MYVLHIPSNTKVYVKTETRSAGLSRKLTYINMIILFKLYLIVKFPISGQYNYVLRCTVRPSDANWFRCHHGAQICQFDVPNWGDMLYHPGLHHAWPLSFVSISPRANQVATVIRLFPGLHWFSQFYRRHNRYCENHANQLGIDEIRCLFTFFTGT